MTRPVSHDDLNFPTIRLRSLEFHLPGEPLALAGLGLPPDLMGRLSETGQEKTFRTDQTSTDLAVEAARKALKSADLEANDIDLVISAPTLLTSYGFEIPAIGIRAELALNRADCLNISQGCVGLLAAMRVAGQFLHARANQGNVLIVTACKATTLVDDYSHGSFFWADAAAATVVTTARGNGLHIESYAEKSSDQDWGAMRVRHGDGAHYTDCDPQNDLDIAVDFPDQRALADYIAREQELCGGLVDHLLNACQLQTDDIKSVILPSIGKNRASYLMAGHKQLINKVKTDFSYAHMGGVDVMFFLDKYLRENPSTNSTWHLAMTPAFTAQWGGVLARYEP